MNEESQELKNRIEHLTDEELLEMVTADAGSYRQEALDYAKAELVVRGVDFENTATTIAADVPGEEPSEESIPNPRGSVPVCMVCGGPLRPGTLVAEKELSIVFTDNREERFLKVNACRQCGHLSLVADYDTEVQS